MPVDAWREIGVFKRFRLKEFVILLHFVRNDPGAIVKAAQFPKY